MEEINYISNEFYYRSANEDNEIKSNNELMRYLEGNFSNSHSEYEVDINNLTIKKYGKKNRILNQEPMLDINTMESIRISHSLERSKNSQSLTDIINDPFIKAQRNSRDENCLNQTIKFKNSNESSLSSNKFSYYNHYNDNNVEQNSFISIKSNNHSDLNRKSISVINEKFFNDNKKIQNIIEKNDRYDINNKCIKKNKFVNIFNRIFEEKIKLLNKDIVSTKKSLKKYDCLKNKNKIKPKLLNYLSQIYLDGNSANNKDKELDIEVNYNNKGKEIEDKSINLKNMENKTLIISNINSINESNNEIVKKEDEEKKDNRKYKSKNSILNKEKKNQIILDVFENENDADSDKNVLISELDIKISNLTSIEENDGKNSPKEKKEVNKNINNTNDDESIKRKYIFLNRKNLNTDFNKNKRKPNNIINYIYKKAFKFNKNIGKIYEKKIYSYKNIKSIKSNKGKKIYNYENDISKKYKNNTPFPNCENKVIIKNKNILNNSRINYTFFELNNSIINRKNINNKTLNSERNNKNYSRILNTSSSLPKNKKIKKSYLKDLFKKNIYTISKRSNVNKNIFKKLNENNISQNNENKEYFSSNKKVYTHSIENKRKIKINKLTKINTSLFNKMNRIKDYNTIKNNSQKKKLDKINKINKLNKKKDFSINNINKDKMIFKKIKRIKKTGIYLNNTKLLKRTNLNNFIKRENLFRKKIEKNNQNASVLLKNDIKIKNIINNSFTQNINLYSYKYKKPINNRNNNFSNSFILTNINNSKNLINAYKNIKSNEKIIAEFKPINKYNTYIINHFINFKEPKIYLNKKRKIINNKFHNKAKIASIKNLTEKNNILKCKTIKKNASELKYKINNILITINNNSHKNILQKRNHLINVKLC